MPLPLCSLFPRTNHISETIPPIDCAKIHSYFLALFPSLFLFSAFALCLTNWHPQSPSLSIPNGTRMTQLVTSRLGMGAACLGANQGLCPWRAKVPQASWVELSSGGQCLRTCGHYLSQIEASFGLKLSICNRPTESPNFSGSQFPLLRVLLLKATSKFWNL